MERVDEVEEFFSGLVKAVLARRREHEHAGVCDLQGSETNKQVEFVRGEKEWALAFMASSTAFVFIGLGSTKLYLDLNRRDSRE